MVLVAFSAVYRPVAGWFEWYFGFLMTVCTGCFVHLSRTTRSETAAASIFVIHVCISVDLIFLVLFSKGCNCKFSHDPLDLYRYMVSDLRTWHKDH